MIDHPPRWVLSFDGTCARCMQVSKTVEQTSQGRLTVLPLSSEDVKRWREQAMGADPAWVPTLINVAGDRVRAWTGVGMGARLAVLLGPRHSVKVLRALGDLRAGAEREVEPDRGRLPRRGLFRLGAGIGVAAGLVLTGQSPAFASTEPKALTDAREWARTVRGPGAGLYDEVTRIAPSYRPVVFGEFTPEVRSHLWTEQFSRYRVAHPDMTETQSRVLADAEAIAADPMNYLAENAEIQARVTDIERAAQEAFGKSEACGLLGRLGPGDMVTTDASIMSCNCHLGSACHDWCDYSCSPTSWPGCGCMQLFTCNACTCA